MSEQDDLSKQMPQQIEKTGQLAGDASTKLTPEWRLQTRNTTRDKHRSRAREAAETKR